MQIRHTAIPGPNNAAYQVSATRYNEDHIIDDTNSKIKNTPEGGVAVKLTNKTGAASVKGTLVSASTTTDNAFALQSNEFDCFGVVYEAGIADGSACWVVVSGIAELLMKDTVAAVRGYIAISADMDGRATCIAVPTATPTSDTHWKEIGHLIESKTAGTSVIAKAIIHFN